MEIRQRRIAALARIFYQCERPAQVALAVIAFSAVICLALPPDFGSHRGFSPCLRNVRQINLALTLYNRDYGCLPPAVTVDADGRAMHCWRVQIAPYLRDVYVAEADGLEAQDTNSGWLRAWLGSKEAVSSRTKARQLTEFLSVYDYSQPWDGPTNRKLAEFRVDAFCCPNRQSTGLATTDYVAVTGPETAWPPDRLIHDADFRDGAMGTLLVVEIRDSDIPWTQPRNLPFADVALAGEGAGPNRIGGHYRSSFNACCADGSVRPVSSSTPLEVLKALFTINGHDDPGSDW